MAGEPPSESTYLNPEQHVMGANLRDALNAFRKEPTGRTLKSLQDSTIEEGYPNVQNSINKFEPSSDYLDRLRGEYPKPEDYLIFPLARFPEVAQACKDALRNIHEPSRVEYEGSFQHKLVNLIARSNDPTAHALLVEKILNVLPDSYMGASSGAQSDVKEKSIWISSLLSAVRDHGTPATNPYAKHDLISIYHGILEGGIYHQDLLKRRDAEPEYAQGMVDSDIKDLKHVRQDILGSFIRSDDTDLQRIVKDHINLGEADKEAILLLVLHEFRPEPSRPHEFAYTLLPLVFDSPDDISVLKEQAEKPSYRFNRVVEKLIDKKVQAYQTAPENEKRAILSEISESLELQVPYLVDSHEPDWQMAEYLLTLIKNAPSSIAYMAAIGGLEKTFNYRLPPDNIFKGMILDLLQPVTTSDPEGYDQIFSEKKDYILSTALSLIRRKPTVLNALTLEEQNQIDASIGAFNRYFRSHPQAEAFAGYFDQLDRYFENNRVDSRIKNDPSLYAHWLAENFRRFYSKVNMDLSSFWSDTPTGSYSSERADYVNADKRLNGIAVELERLRGQPESLEKQEAILRSLNELCGLRDNAGSLIYSDSFTQGADNFIDFAVKSLPDELSQVARTYLTDPARGLLHRLNEQKQSEK